MSTIYINVTLKSSQEDIQVKLSAELQPTNGYVNWRSESPSEGLISCKILPNGLMQDLIIDKEIDTDENVIAEEIANRLSELLEEAQKGFDDIEEEISNNIEGKNKPYNPDEIKVRREVQSIDYIQKLIEVYKDIDLNPEYQRNFVWTDTKQQSRLIESLMLGIPIPVFYFAENKQGKFHVIDGLQRLTVINCFLNDKLKLNGLEYLEDCNGLTYKQIHRKYARRIESTQLTIYIVEASSPTAVKYDIFKRINTGGKPLNRQEVRNAMALPKVRVLLQELASSPIFKTAIADGIKDIRMAAQELVLRFIAFSMLESISTYTGKIDPLLDETIDKLNELDEKRYDAIKQKFYTAMKNANYLFSGKYAFRKILPEDLFTEKRTKLLNRSMFVTWAITLSEYDTDSIQKGNKQGEFAKIVANELKENRSYWDTVSTSTSSIKNIQYAFQVTKNLANQYINL